MMSHKNFEARTVKTVCKKDECMGCMACMDICPRDAIQIKDGLKCYNAVIDESRCVSCGLCHEVCQKNKTNYLMEQISYYQGWTNSVDREKSSSGGAASAISISFIENGGCVCSCVFEKGEFIFRIADRKEELDAFKGSKYVKSNPRGMYKEIKRRLQNGEKVLFIGLPCQVSAIKSYIGENQEENLYTIDLICHGSPSPQLLKIFLEQYGLFLEDIKDIQFRKKDIYSIHKEYQSITSQGRQDSYTIGFLNGLFYTDNCYKCNYARKERVGDITIGDSWGSELSEIERKKGISLILCQTEKGRKLLEKSDLHLEAVDIKKAVLANGQLQCPSVIHKKRAKFFSLIDKGIHFNMAVQICCPKQCIKQKIKGMLIRFGWIFSGYKFRIMIHTECNIESRKIELSDQDLPVG